jgi:hypothetical protein
MSKATKNFKDVSFLVKLEHTLFEFNILLLVFITLGVALLFYHRQPQKIHSHPVIHWFYKIIVQDDEILSHEDYIE